MIGSEKVRAARKKQQLARLKAKGKKDAAETYPAYYAAMPAQKVKAAAAEQIRLDRQDVKDTAEALQIAEITGDGLLAAQEKHEVAKRVLAIHVAAEQPNAQMTLTAAGG
jgi:hypothetical protein